MGGKSDMVPSSDRYDVKDVRRACLPTSPRQKEFAPCLFRPDTTSRFGPMRHERMPALRFYLNAELVSQPAHGEVMDHRFREFVIAPERYLHGPSIKRHGCSIRSE